MNRIAWDYNALTAPLRKDDVAIIKKAAKSKTAYAETVARVVWAMLIILIPLALLGAMSDPVRIILSIGIAIAIIAGLVIRIRHRAQKEAEYSYRLGWFAEANQLRYLEALNNPAYGGMLFGQGYDKQAYDVIAGMGQDPFDIGNYAYTTGTGKYRQTHYRGYVRVQLERRVPHMVLNAKSNNGLFGSSLPLDIDRSQRLELEGDFNKYFTLYCPKQYERDAFYIFTPNLMAQLIDMTQQFDVEVVDNYLYLYSKNELNLNDPSLLQRLQQIIDTVGHTVIRQTDYYADERVGSRALNQIAEPGKRLSVAFPYITITVVVLFLLYMLIMSFMA